jgi:hypothetical protein
MPPDPMPRLALVATFCALAAACVTEPAPRPEPPPVTPDAPLELTLPAINGTPVDFASLRGQVVLIDVMATWSVASQAQVPVLRKLLATYAERGLTVISIAIDADAPALVRTYVETLEIAWPVALAPPDVAEGHSSLGRIQEIPRTLVVDRRGFVRFDQTGAQNAQTLAKAIERAL